MSDRGTFAEVVLDGTATNVLEWVLTVDGTTAVLCLQGLLVAGAVGAPVPEEAVWACAGFLTERGRVPGLATFGMCWATLVVLDALTYEVGRAWGPRVRRSRVGRHIGRRRWATVRWTMRRHGPKAVAGARFVMGTRIATFLLAGATGMPRHRFWIVTAAAGLVSGAVPFVLGRVLADTLPAVLDGLRVGRWVVAGVVAAGIGAWILWRRRFQRR